MCLVLTGKIESGLRAGRLGLGLRKVGGAVGLARAEPDAAKSDLILERSRRVIGRRLGLEAKQ